MKYGISIFGLGYVGTVSLGCLCLEGHRVIGVDIDNNKLDFIRQGIPPIIEEGVQQLIADAIKSGRTEVTMMLLCHSEDGHLLCLGVGNPSNSNGTRIPHTIKRIAAQIGNALKVK